MKILKRVSFVGTSLLASAAFMSETEAKTSRGEESATVPVQAEQVAEGMSGDSLTSGTEAKTSKSEESTTASVRSNESLSTETRLGYFNTFGWMLTNQGGGVNIGMTEDEKESFLAGVRLALGGKPCGMNLGENMAQMQEYFQKRSADYAQKRQEELKVIAEKNRKDGEAHIEALKKKDPSIKTTSTGLSYAIINEGNKAIIPAEEDRVEIMYTGSFIDGKVFDKSEEKPIDFYLNGVIPGIREGLLLLGEGGEITLYIPDSLAYGENDIPGIPAGSLLVFKVKLSKVHKVEQNATEAISEEADKGKEEPVQEVEKAGVSENVLIDELKK